MPAQITSWELTVHISSQPNHSGASHRPEGKIFLPRTSPNAINQGQVSSHWEPVIRPLAAQHQGKESLIWINHVIYVNAQSHKRSDFLMHENMQKVWRKHADDKGTLGSWVSNSLKAKAFHLGTGDSKNLLNPKLSWLD